MNSLCVYKEKCICKESGQRQQGTFKILESRQNADLFEWKQKFIEVDEKG